MPPAANRQNRAHQAAFRSDRGEAPILIFRVSPVVVDRSDIPRRRASFQRSEPSRGKALVCPARRAGCRKTLLTRWAGARLGSAGRRRCWQFDSASIGRLISLSNALGDAANVCDQSCHLVELQRGSVVRGFGDCVER